MKRRIMLMLVSLVLTFCVTACSKQVGDSTVNEPETEQDVSQEAVNEKGNLQANVSDGEIADRMEKFSLGGHEISLPCTVGDFMEGFELESSFPMPDMPNTVCCSYLIDGEPAGVIFVYCKEGKVHDTDYVYAMSVNGYFILKEQSFAFDVSGITEGMTRGQIEEIWGEPDLSETMSIIYCDGEYEDSYYIDKIIFAFDDTSGKISDISFFVDLDRIEEQDK